MKGYTGDGATQDTRMPKGLADNFILPFEMEFPQLLALLADLSKEISIHTGMFPLRT